MPKAASSKKQGAPRDMRISRKPPRCSKCEGKPLRSQCSHTAAGKQFLEDQRALRAKQRHCLRCPGKPLQSECIHTIKGREFLNTQRVQAALQEIDTEEFWDHPIPQDEPSTPYPAEQQTPNADFAIPDNALDPVLIRNHQVEGDISEAHEAAILLTLSTPSATLATNQSSSSPGTQTKVPSTLEQSSPSTHSSVSVSSSSNGSEPTTPCPPSEKVKYSYAMKKASKSNPIYGMVRGAKRGNEEYKIYRRHKLPEPLYRCSDVSRRFARQINKLLEKCEDLAAETGCWLFLGAQHVTARAAAITYTSPRIGREARVPAEQMAELFNTTASQLLIARRTEAVTIQRQLEYTRKGKAAVEKQVEEVKAKIAEYERIFGPIEEA